MLCCLEKYSALSNFSDSLDSCQLSGVMCHFCVCFKIIKQKVKSMVKLGVGGLVINGANPSSFTCEHDTD